MKNVIILYVLSVLFSLLTLSYTNAQNCPQATGYSLSAYDSEIDRRLQKTYGSLNNINIDLQPGNYIILNDKDFSGECGGSDCKWSHIDAYDNAPNIDNITYFILTPGDYRDYQTFKPRFKESTSSADDIKHLLYYPGSSNDSEQVIEDYLNGLSGTPKTAVEQAEHEKAIIENFYLVQDAWSWVIRGITIRGNHNSLSGENVIYGSGSSTSTIISDNNIIKDCLFENQVTGNFLYIINGSDNIIYDCVIRNKNEYTITYIAPGDIIGVTIRAATGTEAENNVLLNNAIYNVTDAVQLTEGENNRGDLRGTLIYGNEMYNEKIYIDECGEERMNGEGAIDVKQGTGSHDVKAPIEHKVIIADNLFYGWRRAGTDGLGREFDNRTQDCIPLEAHPVRGNCWHDANGVGGGAGEAILCHINASNISILYNTVSDCSNGFLISGNTNSGSVGQIEIYDNTICNLYPPRSEYIGNPINGSYWTNTNYVQNAWNLGNGNYLIPKDDGNNDGHCIPNIAGDYEYIINHSIGQAMRITTEYCIIQGNTISGAIKGILLKGIPGQKAVVTNNYIENIYHENFNPTIACSFANFGGNTYSDFTKICTGNGNNPPQSSVIENNCFLNCSGNVMGPLSISCGASCGD